MTQIGRDGFTLSEMSMLYSENVDEARRTHKEVASEYKTLARRLKVV